MRRRIRAALAVLVVVVVHACGDGLKGPEHARPHLDTLTWAKELDSLKIYSRQNELDRQLALANRIYAHTRGIDTLARQQALALGAIASALSLRTNGSDTALVVMRQALNIAETAGDSATVARSLLGIGTISEGLGDHVTALAVYLRALRIRETLNDEVAAGRLMRGIAKLYWQQNDLPAAMDMARRSVDIGQRKDSVYLGESLSTLGTFMLEAGHLDTAVMLFKQSIVLEQRFHPRYGVSTEYYNLGLAYSDQGRLDSALLMFRRGLAEARMVEEAGGGGDCLMGIGDVLLRMGRYAEAGPPLDSGLVLAEENGLPEVIMEVHSSLAEQRQHVGDDVAALKHLRRYQELHDSLMNVEKDATMNELRVRYDTEKKERENQQLRAAQEVTELRAERGRWIAIGAASLALVIGLGSWMLLQRNRDRARRREADLEQQAMRLQMDPHFLFNALNTIPGLYASGDAAHADDHVGHLSKFLRLVLETSRKRTIALSQELELTDNYLHICANRRPGSFTWSVQVSPDVHTERVAVPPMLVQPLVENALDHGLGGVECDGHVGISVDRDGDDVMITVSDNGVGRKAAALRSPHRFGSSMGLGLVRDRIRMMGRSARGADPVTVHDEHHADGSSAGTTVVLRIRNTEPRNHAARSDH